MTTAAIILAAGSSSRLGQPKQLLQFQGETLVARAVRLAKEAGVDAIFVVVSKDADAIRQILAGQPCHLVDNPHWQQGMASSIREAMKFLATSLHPRPASVLVMVCDQPQLDSSHLRQLLHTHAAGNHPVTASHYDGRSGVPAIFSQQLFPELLLLHGDRGARDLIQAHISEAGTVAFPAGALDIDTPSDLARLQDSAFTSCTQ
jgi:molybdenum cofactor cytidylyltransferase